MGAPCVLASHHPSHPVDEESPHPRFQECGQPGRPPANTCLLGSCAPAECGPFFEMPNIQQQKKRVLIASRQRNENLHYRSTIKTLTKRLEAAVAAGDADAIAAEHLALVRLIDKSASNGAIHKNTAGRKKAQAARLVATPAA